MSFQWSHGTFLSEFPLKSELYENKFTAHDQAYRKSKCYFHNSLMKLIQQPKPVLLFQWTLLMLNVHITDVELVKKNTVEVISIFIQVIQTFSDR
jgi:hypothetical protein